ncbi:hypothetical protein [Naasia sp. SYSU D00057]|uniref:hypothetical protein n=1 Tax=Naasia sp. SYSU D00057 TaxID=2817380 RepID=UPI001B311937|nr:hypothetical protein [Naasia sp. SYSU D00057]
MPRTRGARYPGAATAIVSSAAIGRTRGVQPVDYDLSELSKFENMILGRLRSMMDANATDAETLRVLDGHLAAGERELHLGLDVQRTHHQKAAANLVSIAEDNLAAARTRLDRGEFRLDRASRALTELEAKLARHDPEGNIHV